jgi:hypothetical protein
VTDALAAMSLPELQALLGVLRESTDPWAVGAIRMTEAQIGIRSRVRSEVNCLTKRQVYGRERARARLVPLSSIP